LRRVSDGKLVQTFRGGTALSTVQWSPVGQRFAYTDTQNKKATLWLVDLEQGTSEPLLRDVERLENFTWSPEGNFIIYSVAEEPKKEKDGLKRLESPRDRWPWFRRKSYLYRLNLPGGTRQRLTAGSLTTHLDAISPDGKKLVFSRTVDDFSQRPYTRTILSLLDLQDFSVDTLIEAGWYNSAQWSPDGRYLLITGSPSLFGEIGQNVPEGMIPNDYDGQAYLYEVATGKITALTREFDPSIESAVWEASGEAIIFRVTEREYGRLYRYILKSGEFRRLNTEVDVVEGFALAKQKAALVYFGSGTTTPPKAFAVDVRKNRSRILSDPAREAFSRVRFGKVERWSFVNDRGVEIEGRVYYPPDFDPHRKYPCIVYYYGGTVPTTRSFGGRYPKNLFAAQGYVVYVLQPSGAIGYGQAFSALHVNDWGKIASEEIIAGVKKFLEAHPFVDSRRVGCIGASYGGFMTMLLLTKTDLFAAAISHAGISLIPSYWGEGYWGYLYSSVSAANSFPWNRRDIFVEQSPLFHADQVKTPLLLLHGDADTNVPPGESDQFYVALKLLGKEVEYVRVAGQDHHIVDYRKRIAWQKTILAWFDRWLKDQPQWWEELFQ
ncbi:MAG: S9 family peptidase, partial [Calditrichaeota bacterium]